MGQNVKSFPADKNYILKQVQTDLKEVLIRHTVHKVIDFYLETNNPLGLIDPTVTKISNYSYRPTGQIDAFYDEAAAIYRYMNSDNQLELLFDGLSHYQKFSDQWHTDYHKWVISFCQNSRHFVRAILDASVFYSTEFGREELVTSRLRSFIHRYFGLKLYVFKGVRELGVA